jgi:hypothetical protein
MPRFTVLYFETGAAGKCVAHRDVEAQDEREAAERIFGGPLEEIQGKPGDLRAQVAPVDKPNARRLFYDRG